MNNLKLSKVFLITSFLVFSASSFAEDWTISATASCETGLGSTIFSNGGIKASGGTAVVTCPLTKEVGSNAISKVYARMKRASANGADSFCTLSS